MRARRTFVRWNGQVFRRCRQAHRDVLSATERRRLRRGFLRWSPRLVGVPPRDVGPVGFSFRGRAKGAFFCDLRATRGQEGRRVYLPRKCKPPTLQQQLNNLLRGSIRSQTAKVRKPGYEVDHHGDGDGTGFAELAATWMAAHHLSAGQLVRTERHVRGIHMLGEPYHRSWSAFHARHADLRPIRPGPHAAKTRARHRREARSQVANKGP